MLSINTYTPDPVETLNGPQQVETSVYCDMTFWTTFGLETFVEFSKMGLTRNYEEQ